MNGEYKNARDVMNAIKKHDRIIISPITSSMYPLIREQRDAVVLEMPRFPLKKYDVALYERKNGMLVLHRVINADGHNYVFSGDRYVQYETDIADEQICAIMTGFFHKEKFYSVDSPIYRLYCRLWCGNFLVRRMAAYIWSFVKKITKVDKAHF